MKQAEQGEEVIVMRDGEPVVKLVQCRPARRQKVQLGWAASEVRETPGWEKPMSDADVDGCWEANKVRGYLLDTHRLWAASSPGKLSRRALTAKCEAGKLEIPSVGSALPTRLLHLNARVLPLQAEHVLALYGLPLLHHDPFDRALWARARAESLTLVTQDEQMHRYSTVKWIL